MKISCPRSRRRWTQPIRTTSVSAAGARSSPQYFVRFRFPSRSSTGSSSFRFQIFQQITLVPFLLAGVFPALPREGARRQFIYSDNQRIACAELVGKPERLLEFHGLGR